MANEREHGASESEAAPAEREVTGGFFPSMLDIFIDPKKVFGRIAAGMSWWKPFVAVSIVGIALAVVNTPMTNKVMEIQSATMDPEEYEQVRGVMEMWRYLGYAVVPVIVLIPGLIIAGVAHLVNSVISMRANFKKTLALTMFCGFIGVLSQIISSLIIWARGIDTIESMKDLRTSFSPAAFMPDLEGFWYQFSESLSLFQLWYYIIFVLGVAAIFSIERKKAVVTGVAVWLVSLLLLLLQGLGGRGM
jgi:hypothetical protein